MNSGTVSDATRDAMCYRDPDTGHLMMPGTRRPDGTWRKPRRVKEGYVPQDEVPLYESKGKQIAKARANNPIPGLDIGILNMKIDTFDAKNLPKPLHIPGLNPEDAPASNKVTSGKAGKKKKKGGGGGTHTNHQEAVNHSTSEPEPQSADPAKKLRNLRKKLRDIEALQAKLESGEIKNPEKEQLEKVARRAIVEEEIAELEKMQ